MDVLPGLQGKWDFCPGGGSTAKEVGLSNLAFSVNHQLQSDEIDLVVIGPPGARVIEIKHWAPHWIERNQDLVKEEAERVTSKARKIGTTQRRAFPDLPFVEGVILLTQEPSKMRKWAGTEVRGVRLQTLSQWKEAVGFSGSNVLGDPAIKSLCRVLEPRIGVAIDGSLRRLAGYVNLELQTSRDERFHRIYKGNNSDDNLAAIGNSPFHFVGSLVPTQHPKLLEISADLFHSLADKGLPGVTAHRTEMKVFGVSRTVLVTHDENLFVSQSQTLLRVVAKCQRELAQIQEQLRKRRAG